MSSGILCQGCGVEAPTKYAEYHQNIGALVVRFGKTYRGQFCKQCMRKFFWKASLTTLFLGPWGVVSLIVSPFFVINNIARYIAASPMPAVPPGARVPQLDEAAVAALLPRVDEIFARLNGGESMDSVATNVANLVGAITPGQVLLFTAHVARQAGAPQQPPTGGFPVIMPATPVTAVTPPPLPVSPPA